MTETLTHSFQDWLLCVICILIATYKHILFRNLVFNLMPMTQPSFSQYISTDFPVEKSFVEIDLLLIDRLEALAYNL